MKIELDLTGSEVERLIFCLEMGDYHSTDSEMPALESVKYKVKSACAAQFQQNESAEQPKQI